MGFSLSGQPIWAQRFFEDVHDDLNLVRRPFQWYSNARRIICWNRETFATILLRHLRRSRSQMHLLRTWIVLSNSTIKLARQKILRARASFARLVERIILSCVAFQHHLNSDDDVVLHIFPNSLSALHIFYKLKLTLKIQKQKKRNNKTPE